jgi:hypothetical protein
MPINHSLALRSRPGPRESRIECVARLQAEDTKLDPNRRKDSIVMLVVMALGAVVTSACLFVVLSNRYPSEIQGYAMTLLAAIVAWPVGYALGKASR